MLSVEDLKVYFLSDGRIARAVDGVSYDVQKGRPSAWLGVRLWEDRFSADHHEDTSDAPG